MAEESNPDPSTSNRRDFFSTGVRCLSVGAVASFAVFQEIKRRGLAGNPNCIRLNTCNDCVELGSGCQKDKAQKFRADQNA